MRNDERIITEFEMNEQVFVPAGDGEPAKWMRFGDLTLSELERCDEFDEGEDRKTLERFARRKALMNESRRRIGAGMGVILGEVMTAEEMAELEGLTMTLGTTMRAVDKRREAIARDITAGRYRTMRWKD